MYSKVFFMVFAGLSVLIPVKACFALAGKLPKPVKPIITGPEFGSGDGEYEV